MVLSLRLSSCGSIPGYIISRIVGHLCETRLHRNFMPCHTMPCHAMESCYRCCKKLHSDKIYRTIVGVIEQTDSLWLRHASHPIVDRMGYLLGDYTQRNAAQSLGCSLLMPSRFRHPVRPCFREPASRGVMRCYVMLHDTTLRADLFCLERVGKRIDHAPDEVRHAFEKAFAKLETITTILKQACIAPQ